MSTPELRFPPHLAAAQDEEVRALCAAWADDERVEGIIFLGRAYDGARGDAEIDALVVAHRKGGDADAYYRIAAGKRWVRVRFATYRQFISAVREGEETGLKLALRDAFVALDREGRLADVLRAVGPALSAALPKVRVAAAAQVAGALRNAEAALAQAAASDAAAALARACSKLAELELLNGGTWPPDAGPLSVYGEGPARDIFDAIWSSAADTGALGRLYNEASALFRRCLPAAASCVFDFLIKRGGSASLGSVVDSLGLAGILDLDLVFAALATYGLVKVGKEERPLPGLPGVIYEEPVLTLA
jgi:hypothetical protein